MKKIRTLVVDDEPLARSRIIHLLQQVDYIAVVGECKNGKEALTQIEHYRPDLVFLDIQMPDLNGFDVLAKSVTPHPFIIFVTAYDQYALKAFDVHAVDYLLKPYDDERFMTALEHARRQINLRENALLHQKMLRLLDNYGQNEDSPIQKLEVKDRGRTHQVNVNDICYIEAEGNYLHLHLQQRSHLIRQTLQAVEDELDNSQFLRIHRSILVNVNFIERIRYEGNNQFLFIMKNDVQLTSGRSYREAIENYLHDRELRRLLD